MLFSVYHPRWSMMVPMTAGSGIVCPLVFKNAEYLGPTTMFVLTFRVRFSDNGILVGF